MNTKSLRYFLAVAEYRNFTKAAEHLYVTQPALSHHIAELEAELETKLFLRTTRSVSLTPSGEIMYKSAKELISCIEKIAEDIKKADSGIAGELVIGHLMAPFKEILPDLTRKFQIKYPDVEVHYVRKNSGPLIESFLRGEIDVVFTMSHDLIGLKDIEWRALDPDKAAIFMDKNHPLAAAKTIDFKTLAKERFVSLDETEAPVWHQLMLKICAARGFVPNIVAKVDRIDALLMEIQVGLALAIMPKSSSRYYASDLHYIELDGDDTGFSSAVAWHINTPNPGVASFISVMKDYLGN